MPKILHTGDIHLGAPFRFLGDKGKIYRQTIRNTFSRITDLAVKDGYDLMLIAGDLFDSHEVSRSVHSFAVERLRNIGIPVCILPGNHDHLGSNSVYTKSQFPDNVTIIRERPQYVEYPDLDLVVAGNATMSKSESRPQLSGMQRPANCRWFIAMAHGGIQGVGSFDNSARPIRKEALENIDADYVALGDWHRYSNQSIGNVTAFYCGAPEPTTIAQTETGFFASITLGDGLPTVGKVEVGSIRCSSVKIDVSDRSYHEVKSLILEHADDHRILNVSLEGIKTADEIIDALALASELEDDFFHVAVSDRAEVELDRIDPNEYPPDFVVGQFANLMKQKIKGAASADERRVAEKSLQLGLALLDGKKVL